MDRKDVPSGNFRAGFRKQAREDHECGRGKECVPGQKRGVVYWKKMEFVKMNVRNADDRRARFETGKPA